MVRQLALQVGQLAWGRAEAAELDGYAGGEQAGVADGVERLGHEGALDVVAAGVLGQDGRDGGGAVEEGVGAGVFESRHAHEGPRPRAAGDLVQVLDLAGTTSGLPPGPVRP